MTPDVVAAAVLDPLNWELNALENYIVPMSSLDADDRAQLKEVLERFSKETSPRVATAKANQAEAELTALQIIAASYKQTIRSSQELSVKVVEGRDVKVLNASHDTRLGVCVNLIGSKSSLGCHVAAILMRMPVTACASERNWSRWGLLFTPNRNLLGLDQASKLVFIQSNDPMTRVGRGYDAFVE